MKSKRLYVFDFDDTLAVTDSKIWVTDENAKKFSLTPSEFATYERKSGDVFDYVEFRQLINPRIIMQTCLTLRQAYDWYGPKCVVVLSARTVPEPIQQFLNDINLRDIEVIALNDASSEAKASQVDRWIRERDLDYVEFFDDSSKNIIAVKALRDHHPGVHIAVTLVTPE